MSTTQSEALRLADDLDSTSPQCETWHVSSELRRLHTENAELQAGYDAARLEIDHLRDATKMMGRWYMVTHDGVATLCEDRRDAEKEAKDADMAWPHSGPHRAVQLVEASTAGFTAADMATAESRGFRDGVASVAASAGEPVATVFTMEALTPGGGVKYHATIHKALPAGTKLYTHPSPPDGMVGGWMPIETAPKDGTAIDLWRVGGGREPCAVWGLPPHCCGEMGRLCDSDWHDYQQGWVTDWFDEPEPDSEFTHWMHLPPQPTTSAGSGKGE